MSPKILFTPNENCQDIFGNKAGKSITSSKEEGLEEFIERVLEAGAIMNNNLSGVFMLSRGPQALTGTFPVRGHDRELEVGILEYTND